MISITHTQSLLLASVLTLGLTTSLPAYANSHGGNDYINVAIGFEDFDNDRLLKRENLLSLGYEHRYNSKWATEFFLMDSSPRLKGGGEVDLFQYGIDALYYIGQDNAESYVQPYLAFGLGVSDFDSASGSDDETQARLGLGLRYLLNQHWSLRGDTRLLYSDESETIDNTLTIGLSYAFSRQKAMKKPMEKPIEEPTEVMDKDSDADGVFDADDQCPATHAGAAVDSKGCALDSDGDGVADYQDKCPSTSTGVSVDAQGCPLDTDSDGVADQDDICPDTPAGVAVDSKGCVFDTDKDGVPNYRDNCPNTPAGRSVDAQGCKYVLKRTEEITLKINFSSNSSNISEAQYAEIESVAKFLQKYGEVITLIEGHTDDRGATSYNQTLSQSRANAVRNVLIERFAIAASRVTAKGFGESRPIETNDTKAGRLANRRVIAVMKAEIEE